MGADIIVGFPGETDTMFENTRRMVEDLPFTTLHVFSYSPRKGTEAAGFTNDVPKTVKKERNKILTELGNQKARQVPGEPAGPHRPGAGREQPRSLKQGACEVIPTPIFRCRSKVAMNG